MNINHGTVTLKLSSYLVNQVLRHKEVSGIGIIAPSFLTWELGGGEWSASCPDRLTPGERAPGTTLIGELLGPRAGLNAVEERKTFCPYWESNPSIQPAARRYSD
jgi:hypothetical protein